MGNGLHIKQWNGEQIKKLLQKKLDARMRASGQLMVSDIQQHLQVEGSRGQASLPGEDPHRRHGDLIESISYAYDPETKKLRVGTSLAYGMYLELGTRLMAARPFLRNGWARSKQQIRDLFSE